MVVALPARTPNISIAWPDNGTREILPMSGDSELESMTGEFLIDTDSRGKFLSIPGVGTTVNLSRRDPIPASPPLVGAVWMRLVVEIPMTEDTDDGQSNVSVFANQPSIGDTGTHDGTSAAWDLSYSTSDAGTSATSAQTVGYAEHRMRIPTGGLMEWSAHDPFQGVGSGVSGFGASPVVDIERPFVTNLNVQRHFDNESPRIYAWDVWFDRLPGGMWNLRQRQTATGNAGGHPQRQRQNGGHTGAWPLRQRQTGI